MTPEPMDTPVRASDQLPEPLVDLPPVPPRASGASPARRWRQTTDADRRRWTGSTPAVGYGRRVLTRGRAGAVTGVLTSRPLGGSSPCPGDRRRRIGAD